MICRRISCINNTRGQALVEFIIAAMLFSVLFMGILFFGRIGAGSFTADIEARNRVMAGQGGQDQTLFRGYVLETAEMGRFVRNIEPRINPAGLQFYRSKADAGFSITKGAFPAMVHRFHYSGFFAMDYLKPGRNIKLEEDALAILLRDLFGVSDTSEVLP